MRVSRTTHRLAAVAAAAALTAGAAWTVAPAQASPDPAAAAAAPADARLPSDGGLTPDQRRRADQLISVFENSTTEIQYGYAENIGTAGA
ncbi:hypothetical protein ACFV0O_34830 [Kitasatospora sp. NPDC059577]|uniref:hypothetical protein n=1 Tax=Kitasatospora sp. NPDC059577 TaxID=3346873 RepID=UPI0036C5D03C